MSKGIVIWAIVIAFIFFFVFRTDLVTNLFIVFIMGIVPGTDIVVPFWVAMLLYPLFILAILFSLGSQIFFIGVPRTKKTAASVTTRMTRKKKRRVAETTSTRRRYRTVV